MLLDTDTIIRRQQNLRISQRQLAATLGVALTVIARLEDGTNHDDLPLHLVLRLADALAVRPEQILEDQPDPEPDEKSDSKTVGAMLAQTDTLTPTTAIAEALGWTLARTERALAQLADDLPDVGLKLHRLRGQVKLVPNNDATTPRDVEDLVRLHHARDGMNRTEAQVLRTVLQGGDSRSLQGNSQQVALGRLRNAGYITRDETPALTDEVRYCLHPVSEPNG